VPRTSETSARATPPRASAVRRDAEHATQVWFNFEALREAASTAGLPSAAADALRARARELVEQAEPVRVSFAADQLALSDTAVRSWIDAGLLEPAPTDGPRPLRITMATFARAKEVVDELRQLGQGRNLVRLVLSRLEGEERAADRPLRRSSKEMAAGKRREWPEDFLSALQRLADADRR
jgi:hypothetical protein